MFVSNDFDRKDISFKDIAKQFFQLVKYKWQINQRVTIYTALPEKLKRGTYLDPEYHAVKYPLYNSNTNKQENFLIFTVLKDRALFQTCHEWSHLTDSTNNVRHVLVEDPNKKLYIYKAKVRLKHLSKPNGKIPGEITNEILSFNKVKISKRIECDITDILKFESLRSRCNTSALLVQDKAAMETDLRERIYKLTEIPSALAYPWSASYENSDIQDILKRHTASIKGINNIVYDKLAKSA